MNTFLTYESTLLIWELLSKRVLFSFIFWHIRKRTLLIWKLLSKRVLFSYTNLYSGKSTLLVPKRVWIITWIFHIRGHYQHKLITQRFRMEKKGAILLCNFQHLHNELHFYLFHRKIKMIRGDFQKHDIEI